MLTFQQTTPEKSGIPSSAVLQFLGRLEAQNIPMHSVLLLRHGKLVLNAYYAPYKSDSLHRMYSVTKSFTSLAVSLLAQDGFISLSDPISRYFPEMLPEHPHPWITEMTIEDLLTMRTCHDKTTYKLDLNTNWVSSFFNTAPTHPAGAIYHYDTSASHTLAALVEKLSGMDMLDYMRGKFLDELNFSKDAFILKDPFGVSIGGSGLVALPMDLMKVGWLLYNNGKLENKQLLDEQFLKKATASLTSTSVAATCLSQAQGYGYQFWRTQHDGYTCFGMGGQYLLILPAYDLIMVTTANTQGLSGGDQAIHDALFEDILPVLSNTSLPEDNVSYKLLEEKVRCLHILPLENMHRPAEHFMNGRVYMLHENTHGYQKISVSIEGAAGVLTYSLNQEPCTLNFGMGMMSTGIFPGYHVHYVASGAWLDDGTLFIKIHIIDKYLGFVYFQLSFTSDEIIIFVSKKEENLFSEYSSQHLYGNILGS